MACLSIVNVVGILVLVTTVKLPGLEELFEILQLEAGVNISGQFSHTR